MVKQTILFEAHKTNKQSTRRRKTTVKITSIQHQTWKKVKKQLSTDKTLHVYTHKAIIHRTIIFNQQVFTWTHKHINIMPIPWIIKRPVDKFWHNIVFDKHLIDFVITLLYLSHNLIHIHFDYKPQNFI